MAETAPLPDAAPTNWVDRHAPPALRPWLKLGRFDRPTGIWLLMLPGWQGIALADAQMGRAPNWLLLVEFFFGAALMRAAGCAYNDIVDRDIDAKVARTAGRPIASGRISVGQAWAFLIGCSVAALLILLTMGPLAIALGVGSLVLVAAYPFMKRITWWPQAWLGLTFNWGALLGYAAATTHGPAFSLVSSSPRVMEALPHSAGGKMGIGTVFLDLHPSGLGHLALPALLLYASGVFWTLGYDTIYAIQDLEDDALAGVKSSARRLGARAPQAVGGFYALAVVMVAAAGYRAGLGLLFVPFLALYAVHLWLQARRVKVDEPRRALALFKANTWAGVILFVALAAGAVRL